MSTFLVTNADMGIGADVALALAADGHSAMATSRSGNRPEAVPPRALLSSTTLDPRDEESARQAIERTVDVFGGLDGVVLHTGVTWFSPVELIPTELFAKTLDSQVLGTLRLLQAALPHLRRSEHGRIIAVSTLGAQQGLPTQAGCCAVKSGLEALLDSLRFEVERFGITVTIVQSGYALPSDVGRLNEVRGLPSDTVYEPLLELIRNSEYIKARGVDPRDVIDSILDVARAERPPFRVPLGQYAAIAEELRRSDEATATETFVSMMGLEPWLTGASG